MLNQNKKLPPRRLWLRVFKSGELGGGQSYCLAPPAGFDSVEYVRVENQNECDHVIGVYWLSRTDIATARVSSRNQIEATDYAFIFNHCPDCGARIDWEKIEEMVKDENSDT